MKQTMMVVMLLLAAVASFGDELAVGAKAPGFALTNSVDGKTVSFKPGDGKISVVVFTCNQCPYAKAFEARIVSLGKKYAQQGVAFYAIDPNDDRTYPIEAAAEMRARATSNHYPYPYLKDGDSRVAREYGARVTPHVFVVDGSGVVRYRGYVDDSARPEERQHLALQDALDAMLAGKTVPVAATKAFGCSIKFSGGDR